MPLYNIGYGTEEESKFTQFSFDRQLSKDELACFVHRASINALRYAVNHRDKFFWGIRGRGPSFQELYPTVIEELKLFGFTPIEYAEEWSCFGWGSVCANDWESHTGLEEKLLRESIPEELRQQVLEISRQQKERQRTPN